MVQSVMSGKQRLPDGGSCNEGMTGGDLAERRRMRHGLPACFQAAETVWCRER